MKKRKKDLFQSLSLILGILLTCGILFCTVSSMSTTGRCYAELKNADLSQEFEGTLYYSDRLYTSIGYGISVIPGEAGNEARLASFLSSSLLAINTRILSCGLLYSMMICVVLQYFLFARFQNERKKRFLGVAISSVAPYAVFTAAVLISEALFGLPILLPEGRVWLLIGLGLLSTAAGAFVLNAVLSAIRRKKLAAVLAIPAALILLIVSMNLESHLFLSPTEPSFDYFYLTHADALEEDYEGTCYYDESRDAILLDGVEYPPEYVENPRYYRGWKRACAGLFELVFAHSGTMLPIIEQITEFSLPLWAQTAYAVKAAAWIVLSVSLTKRRRMPEPVREG